MKQPLPCAANGAKIQESSFKASFMDQMKSVLLRSSYGAHIIPIYYVGFYIKSLDVYFKALTPLNPILFLMLLESDHPYYIFS